MILLNWVFTLAIEVRLPFAAVYCGWGRSLLDIWLLGKLQRQSAPFLLSSHGEKQYTQSVRCVGLFNSVDPVSSSI